VLKCKKSKKIKKKIKKTKIKKNKSPEENKKYRDVRKKKQQPFTTQNRGYFSFP